MSAIDPDASLQIELRDDCRRKRIKTEDISEVHTYQFNEMYSNEQKELILPVSSSSTLNLDEENTGVCPGMHSSRTNEYQKKVLSLLERLVCQNDIIIEKISKFTNIYGTSITTNLNLKNTNFPLDLPLDTEEEMAILEEYLKVNENFNTLVSYFSTFGGKDVVKATHKILSTLLTDKLATDYSYKGMRLGKKSFESLTVNSVIMCAVVSNIPGSTFKDVEEVMKNWLKHASNRLKLRGRKNHGSSAMEVTILSS